MAVARARQSARNEFKQAEAALAGAEAHFDESCGIGVNLAPHSRLRAAEKRVEAARSVSTG
jgi:hypothetical protein